MRPDSQLRSFIAKFSPSDQRRIRAVRAAVRKRFPTAHELVYDNYNFLVIGYSPTERPSDGILSVVARANRVAICLFHGAKLPDPQGILRGAGKQVRFLTVESAATLGRADVRSLVSAAVERSNVPFRTSGRGKLVIRAISAKQRPRQRPVPKVRQAKKRPR